MESLLPLSPESGSTRDKSLKNKTVMKIEILKSTCGIGYAYMEGAKLECSKAFGKELCMLGYAIEMDEDSSDLPEDFPGREFLIQAGIDSLASVQEIATIEQLVALKGIGKKTAENILDYLNE